MSEEQEKIAIFGGTFDPPHVGHVLAVYYVLLSAGVDKVLIVPCAEHPFGKDQISFQHRLAMCRIAFAMLGDAVDVLDIEGNRSGMSFTIDTVRQLAEEYPGVRLELIIGSDNVADLPKWKDIDELKQLVDLRILPRLDDNTAESESAQESSFYLPRISSSSLREMLREGQDVSAHVPGRVLGYIARHGLYER